MGAAKAWARLCECGGPLHPGQDHECRYKLESRPGIHWCYACRDVIGRWSPFVLRHRRPFHPGCLTRPAPSEHRDWRPG